MPAATTLWGGRRWSGKPPSSMLPAPMRWTLEIALRVELFPAPLAPIRVTISPSGTSIVDSLHRMDLAVVEVDVSEPEHVCPPKIGLYHLRIVPDLLRGSLGNQLAIR